MSGAVTNTPGLGAAQQAYVDSTGIEDPTISLGYAVAYPLGVVGIILTMIFMRFVLRVDYKKEDEGLAAMNNVANLPHRYTVEFNNEMLSGKTIAIAHMLINRQFVVSRVMHANGEIVMADGNTVLTTGDRLRVICTEEDSEAILAFFGKPIEMSAATFVPLVGSDIDVFQKDGIILFMEEIGENLRNIDRMFNSIELHGVMENVKGVILGEFVDSGTDLDYESAEAMLSQYLKKYDIPVLCGFPAGHDDVNLPIVMGAKVKIDVDDDGSTLAFDIDGDKKTIDTDKLTEKTSLSKALLKMLAGKIFKIEE